MIGMQLIADLQLHSRYSRAVSQKMDLFEIARWSSRKGIQLVATGDWQHPLWFREIQTHLTEASSGIYKLKSPPEEVRHDVRFLLSTEISSIYTQGGKMRRVHNLVFSPSVETCQKIIKTLRNRGANLLSDGRPIVGISSKDLLQMLLEIDERILLIPAHAWTPWFSIFGSMSGFDSIEECFGSLSKHIYAIETGLSSDPIMNWQIKELDNRSIVSFSDAHSGPKLGREATVFVENNPPAGGQNDQFSITNLQFADITDAIKRSPDGKLKIGYTIEFFPEEGKYHWTGHRICGVKFSAFETKTKGKMCPVCKRSLTVGVENRVLDLSYKSIVQEELHMIPNSVGTTFVYDKEKKRVPFVSLIPLQEILLEINNHSPTKSLAQYHSLTDIFATEFDILLRKSYDDIRKHGGEKLERAIRIVRERKVRVDPGFDGVFGIVKIFGGHATKTDETTSKSTIEEQTSLF